MTIKGGIFKTVKDIIFPVFCLSCGVEGNYLCVECLKKIDSRGRWFCPVCHQKTRCGEPCPDCVNKSFLNCQIAIAEYREADSLGKLIHDLKYNFAEDTLEIIQQLVHNFVDEFRTSFVGDVIVPVPLHKKRFVERGFNQAEKIAQILGCELNLPVITDLVKRQKNTKQQAKLSKEGREENMKSAFCLSQAELSFKRFVVVDDVFTTGSTMQSCAEVLRQAGAEEVVGFSLARG